MVASGTNLVDKDLGLSRRQRIVSSTLYQDVFDKGKTFSSKTLVMWLLKRKDAEQRLGVMATRRTFRRAVDRNRAKRLLREAFRLNRWRMTKKADVILMARVKIRGAKRQDVERDLLNVFKYANVVD